MTYQLPLANDLIVDNFAGGGGASCGIEMALGRPVNIAINHDPDAIGMHEANHPLTRHYCESVWDVNPQELCGGRRVALAWFSPDCKHFSKAKGGALRDKNIRGLAWVALRWAALKKNEGKPDVIIIENVEEFVTWGPLVDGVPDPKRKGQTFRSFINALQAHSYVVDMRELRACDYGAPTIRKRLFIVARCDGQPIIWPKPTHGQGLLPYRTAADCIDWSIPCPSIFERERPLAENTMNRIARGLKKFVFDAKEPFILNLTHGGRLEPIHEPLRTITCAKRGEKALVVPYMVGAGGPTHAGEPKASDKPFGTLLTRNHTQLVVPHVQRWFGQSIGSAYDDPMGTVTAGGSGKTALCTAFLAKHFGGMTGVEVDKPLPTTTTRGTQTQLVTSHIMKMRGENVGSATDNPLHTISAGGQHHAEVRAFLLKYYGNEKDGHSLIDPLGSVTTKDRFGLITIHGQDYVVVDTGMRMLAPRELFRAQGFPDIYIIDRKADGSPLNKTAQVRMCGNSVCPPLAAAIVRANVQPSVLLERLAR